MLVVSIGQRECRRHHRRIARRAGVEGQISPVSSSRTGRAAADNRSTSVAKAADGYNEPAAIVVGGLSLVPQDSALRPAPRFRTGGPFESSRGAGGCAVRRVGNPLQNLPPRPRPIPAFNFCWLPGTYTAAERCGSRSASTSSTFRSAAPAEAFTEVMTDVLDFYYLPIAGAAEHQGRQDRGAGGEYAETGAGAADVPTVAEAGYPDAQYLFWGGLACRRKRRGDRQSIA
jgi:hypothetical protein